MRVAIYARVSTEQQEARGTIGSQVAELRTRAAQEGHEIVAEFLDDGYSGARFDRPGLDALRDAAEAGQFEVVWCLSPDRLARVYAYQVIVLDELARHGVRVLFADAPAMDDDPQVRLLTQIQGVIAEYERAKMTERYRRGKLYRSRTGEVISGKVSYGYRRIPRGPDGPAHLVVFEPEAVIVKRIFADYLAGHSIRQVVKQLYADSVPSPTGKAMWGLSTVGRILRNEAYVGRVYYNRTSDVVVNGATRRRRRPQEEWIAIAVPALITEDAFAAAQQVSRDLSKFSPRTATPNTWLLRGLVVCGTCGVRTNCARMRGRNGSWNHYYACRNHDPLRARGEERRCRERNIRADALDGFVFDQVRELLQRPDVLLAGQHALAARSPTPDDELLGAQLARLEQKRKTVEAERRRLIDLYQAGLIELAELQRRAREVETRRAQLERQQDQLANQRRELARENRLRQRIGDFGRRVLEGLDGLDFEGRQRLLRLVIEEVRVNGWRVEIRLRIPLDDGGDNDPAGPQPEGPPSPRVSSDIGLRSLHHQLMGAVCEAVEGGVCEDGVGEKADPFAYVAVARDDEAGVAVTLDDERIQVFGLLLAEAMETEVVDDEKVRAR